MQLHPNQFMDTQYFMSNRHGVWLPWFTHILILIGGWEPRENVILDVKPDVACSAHHNQISHSLCGLPVTKLNNFHEKIAHQEALLHD